VICSTATRAKQALDPILKAVNPLKVILEREIYGGTGLCRVFRLDVERAMGFLKVGSSVSFVEI